MKEEKRIRVRVKGRVQAVGYRFFVQQKAVLHHVTGFVRNQTDFSVVLEAQGEKANLEAFLNHLRKGPHLAQVEAVNVDWIPRQEDDGDFQISF